MNIERYLLMEEFYVFYSLYFFNNLNYYDYLFLFLIMFIGILSDLDILRSPSKRLIIQILIITTYVIIKDETINSTRIFMLITYYQIPFFLNIFLHHYA